MENNLINDKIEDLIINKKLKEYYYDLNIENLYENQILLKEEIFMISNRIEEFVYNLDILNSYLAKNINIIKKEKNMKINSFITNINIYIKKNLRLIKNHFEKINNVEFQNFNKINIIWDEIKLKLDSEKEKIFSYLKNDNFKKIFEGFNIQVYLFFKYNYYIFNKKLLSKNINFINKRIKFLKGNLNEDDLFYLLLNNNEHNLILKYQNLINNEKNDKSFEEISKIYFQNNKSKFTNRISPYYFSNSSINGLLKNYYNLDDKSVEMNNLNMLKEINEESNNSSKFIEKSCEIRRKKARPHAKTNFHYNYYNKEEEVPDVPVKLSNKIEKEYYYLKTNQTKNLPTFNPYLSKIYPPEKCGYELIYINIIKNEKLIEILNENQDKNLLTIKLKSVCKFLLGTYTTSIINKSWNNDKCFNLPFSIIYQSGLKSKVKLDLLSNSINHINIIKKFIETFTKKNNK